MEKGKSYLIFMFLESFYTRPNGNTVRRTLGKNAETQSKYRSKSYTCNQLVIVFAFFAKKMKIYTSV